MNIGVVALREPEKVEIHGAAAIPLRGTTRYERDVTAALTGDASRRSFRRDVKIKDLVTPVADSRRRWRDPFGPARVHPAVI
jgi:hypothetical protein